MRKISLIVFLVGIIFIPLVSLAAGLVPCGGADEPSCRLCHFFVLFDNIVKFLLLPPPAGGGIVPGIAALMIAIGGFMYIFAYAGGTGKGPEVLSTAKRLFTAVAIGLLIIYGAWIIVNTFFMFIGVQEWTGLEEWWKIDCP